MALRQLTTAASKGKIVPHRFSVVGYGHFPMDMLRRERCWADSAHDSRMIGGLHDSRTRTVTLFTMQRGDWKPAEKLWLDYGWPVLQKEIE
jgi:hypothetical protein